MSLPVFPSSRVGSDEQGLCLDCCEGAWMWHGAHCSFGLVSGMFGPFLYPHQLPASPCVRTVWARAVIIPATVAISTCLLGLVNPDRPHTWCVNDDTLGFALVFSYSLCFPLFLADLFRFEFLWSYTFLYIWCSCISLSPGFSSVYLVSGLFLAFSFFHLIPGPAASPSRRVIFDWYDEVLGFSRLDFVYTVCLRHGPESLFIFTYRR